MAATAVFVHAVGNAVVRDGDQRPMVRNTGPQLVVRGGVRSMNLPGAGGPEVLARIRGIPAVEVRHLRTVRGSDSTNLSSLHQPCASREDRQSKRLRNGARRGLMGDWIVDRGVGPSARNE